MCPCTGAKGRCAIAVLELIARSEEAEGGFVRAPYSKLIETNPISPVLLQSRSPRNDYLGRAKRLELFKRASLFALPGPANA